MLGGYKQFHDKSNFKQSNIEILPDSQCEYWDYALKL